MASIYKRGRVWWSNIFINGRRIRRPLARDKRIAEEKMAELIKDRESQKYGVPFLDITWDEFKKKYLAYSESSKSPNTYKRDCAAISVLEQYEMPRRLRDITNETIEGFKTARKGKKKGTATINRDIGAIKAMLKKAFDWGYLKSNFWTSVKRFKESRGRLHYFSLADIKRLLTICRGEWKTICMLGAMAGLRRSEIYWLSWNDVDLNRNILSVTPKEGWNPKDFEVRHIPVTHDLRIYLAGLKRPSEWVLAPRPSLAVMSVYFRRLVKKAGFAGGIHTLRHTYASLLAQNGVDLYTIARLLGHQNVKTTQIYAHLSPDTFQLAIERFPRIASH